MLARNYRFGVYNDTGGSVAATKATIKARRWKGAGDGTREDEGSEASVFNSTAAINDGVYKTGVAVSNSSVEWEGGDFEFEVTTTASTGSGSLTAYYEVSTDGGTSFPSSRSQAIPVCVLPTTGNTTYRKIFQL